MSSDLPNNNLYDKLINLLRSFYADLRQGFALLTTVAIIVTGVLLLVNYWKSSTYKSSFTVVYEDLVRKVYGDKLDKLDLLLKNDKPKAQSLMNISDEAISSLKEIQATNILGEPLSEDMNVDKIPFVVELYTQDTAYVHEIQKGVLYYLETGNKYLKEKRRLKTKEIAEELQFIEEQLKLMEELKKTLKSPIVRFGIKQEKSEKSESSTDNSGSVYEASYELYKKKQELLKKKELPLNLYVIDDAIVPIKNSKSNIMIVIFSLVISMIIYTVLRYLILPVVRTPKT